MTGEPTHTGSIEGILSCTPVINYRLQYASMSACYTASLLCQPVTQHCESRTVRNAPVQSK